MVQPVYRCIVIFRLRRKEPEMLYRFGMQQLKIFKRVEGLGAQYPELICRHYYTDKLCAYLEFTGPFVWQQLLQYFANI